MAEQHKRNTTSIRDKIHEVIFEADTPEGKTFDVALFIVILASVFVVMLESMDPLREAYYDLFVTLEWVFTGIFTIEYLLRLYCVYRPWKYALSFFGIIDLLAIFPTYLSLFIGGAQYFLIVRALRLLRVFRIFKLGHFLREGDVIMKAMLASRAKITVFLTFVLLMVTLVGALMYLVEGGSNPSFSDIPKSIYWAVVTLTTVGYGDITPITGVGQFLSAAVMILGYAVLAVPTGIVSAEFIREKNLSFNTKACHYCGHEGHDDDAKFCKFCGEKLEPVNNSG